METENKNFIGRNQLAIESAKLLGHEFTRAETEETVAKDIAEHAQVLKEAERIVEDIKSGDLKHQLGAFDVHERVRKLLQTGYENSVLSFDTQLEESLLEIMDSAAEVLIASSDKEDIREQTETMRNLTIAMKGMQYPTLGGLVAGGDENSMVDMPKMQKAWFVYALLNDPNALQLTFLLGEKEELTVYGEAIRALTVEMLGKKTISTEEFERANANYLALLDIANH